jgi:hypothetical protein
MVSKPPSHAALPAVSQDGQPPTLFDLLGEINAKLDGITERLGKGDTALALLEHRVASLEKIVYGMVGVILLAVVGALVALVVK